MYIFYFYLNLDIWGMWRDFGPFLNLVLVDFLCFDRRRIGAAPLPDVGYPDTLWIKSSFLWGKDQSSGFQEASTTPPGWGGLITSEWSLQWTSSDITHLAGRRPLLQSGGDANTAPNCSPLTLKQGKMGWGCEMPFSLLDLLWHHAAEALEPPPNDSLVRVEVQGPQSAFAGGGGGRAMVYPLSGWSKEITVWSFLSC